MKTQPHPHPAKRLTIAVASLLFSSLAVSQPLIEEMVISADLLNRVDLEMATSISVVDQQAIESLGARQLEQVLGLTPNVNFSSGASRGRFLQVRGIGERSQFIVPRNASVGVVLDGIDVTGISTVATTLDLEQIEILRGPQGTIYGANALAGLVYLKSASVSSQVEGSVGVGIGNYASQTFDAAINLPLTQELGARFAVMQTLSDGYIKNATLDVDNTNNIDEFSGRAKIQWLPSSNLGVDLTLFSASVDNGYDAFTLDNSRTTLSDEPGRDTQDTDAASLQATWTLKQGVRLESLLSHADSSIEYSYDEDWTSTSICDDTACDFDLWGFDWWYSSFDQYFRDNSNTTFDTRIVDTDGHVHWVAGVYYRDQTEDLVRNYTYLSAPFESSLDTENSALYGELTTDLTSDIALSVGLRYEQRDTQYQDSDGVVSNTSEDFWGGKISLEKSIGDDRFAYALISRGYKAGGVNDDPTLDAEYAEFDAEYMWNYELGLKGSWLGGRSEVQLALFYQDREDVQTSSSFVIPVSGVTGDPCPCQFIEFTDNAAGSNSIGLEFENRFFVSERTRIDMSLGLLQTEYEGYLNPSHVLADEENGIAYDMSGRDLAHAPNYMFALSLEHNITDALTWNLGLQGKDSFYFSDSHDHQSDRYQTFNTRLTYTLDSFSFSVWGRNLTDEDVQVRGFGSFGNDPRDFYVTEPYYQYGEPRVWGVSSRFTF